MSESAAAPPTFEQSLAELERVVQCLEEGGIGLEESLDLYEKGVGLLKLCYTQLRKAEQRIQVLVSVDDDNQPQVEPFEHQASAPEKRPGRRRTAKGSADDQLPL
jgi:exodeoxyribonuclease VII small subunit